MKLLDFARQFAEATGATMALSAENCLHSWDHYSECRACVQACPVEAIEAGRPPVLDGEKCQDCRACLASCPTGACFYSGIDAGDALQQSIRAAGLKRVEIVCAYNSRTAYGLPGSEAAIKVRGCLAGLGTGAYLLLAGLGLEEVLVRTDACPQCPWPKLPQQVADQVEAAQRLWALWNRGGTLEQLPSLEGIEPQERPAWWAESPPRSRRSLFRIPAGQEENAGPEEPQLFPNRRRFLKAMKQMAAGLLETGQAIPLDGLGFARLSVSVDCSACGACARACPTEAITFEKEETAFRLSFSPQLCLGCAICDHVCWPKAIEIDHAPTFDQVFGPAGDELLQEGALVRCNRCKALFAGGHDGQLCPVCAFRAENPFGSAMPPGLGLSNPGGRANDLRLQAIAKD